MKDTDKGLKSLLARCGKGKIRLTVGVHAEEGAGTYPGGATVADVATWNEFGTERIPARPFLSGWVDGNQGLIAATLRKAGEKIVKGAEPLAALDAAAQFFAGRVQAGIAAGVPPPNAESTAKRKGSGTPLVNTGQLRSSIRGKAVAA